MASHYFCIACLVLTVDFPVIAVEPYVVRHLIKGLVTLDAESIDVYGLRTPIARTTRSERLCPQDHFFSLSFLSGLALMTYGLELGHKGCR